MRAPAFLVGFVQWRWTPSVALVAGSLAFIGIVVLIVPDDFGGVTSGADRVSRAARQGVVRNVDAPADESTELVADEVPPPTFPEHRPAALPATPAPPANNIVQSIFHSTPKTELRVEPVDPNPPPPPEPPPPPAPTQTVYTLESPPPAAPNPLEIPAAAPEVPPQ